MSLDFSATRATMIDSQLKTVGVIDKPVLDAIGTLPRELFLPDHLAGLAYADATPELAAGRSLLVPMVLALLLQTAEVKAGERALVIGSATGYSAAVLLALGAQVTALESDADLAARARVPTVIGPLAQGWAAAAPYDIILFEGSIETVPPAIAAQLAPGGRIAAVVRDHGVGGGYAGPLNVRGEIAGLPFMEMGARPLPGFERPREFAF